MRSPIYNREYVLIYNNECALTAPFWYDHKKRPAARNCGPCYFRVVTFSVLLQLSEVLDGANHLRSVRVLVVVPRNNLHLISCLCSVEERTEAHAEDIRRNDLLVVVTEALVSSSLHSGVNAVNSYILALDNSVEQSCRTVWHRYTLCSTDQLAVQLRPEDRRGSSGRQCRRGWSA